jgi:hypothetical protein
MGLCVMRFLSLPLTALAPGAALARLPALPNQIHPSRADSLAAAHPVVSAPCHRRDRAETEPIARPMPAFLIPLVLDKFEAGSGACAPGSAPEKPGESGQRSPMD